MRNKPRIRFKGFTEDWEQRKLLTVLNKIVDYRGRTPKKLGLDWSPTGHLALSALNVKMGYIDKTVDAHYGDDHLYSVWMKDNDIYEGQVLFTTEAPMGNVAQVPDDNKYILSQRTIAFVPDRSVISDNFLAVVLSASKCQKSLTNRASGGTAKGVSQKTLSEISLDIPKSLSEQDKVSELIKKLSKVITLHQRKLEKLKLAKKALLQKLFPKNGSQFPEIRFKGFTDAWEQRKLIDIAKTFIGLVTTMTENYRDSGTLLIRNSDIKEGQFVFSENPIHLDEEFAEKNKTRRLQIGDVVTVHTGDIGTSAVIEEKEAGAIGFATINTRTDKSILNPYFLATYFNTEKHKCYANSVSTGDGRSNYNIKDFNKLVISVPTLDEQERISVLINDMNTIITLHQRKLDKLQDMKKGLLQKMFV